MNGIPNEAAQTEDFEFAALSEAKNYRHALLAEYSGHLRGTVLEVGAGIGQLTGLLLKNDAIGKLVSIEPDARFCARLRQAFPSHTLVQGTILNAPEERWDAILNINVLEHIPDDRLELERYRRLLAPAGGTLCLFVPARPEIYAPIDRDFGHFRRYTRAGLRARLQQAGFEVLKLRYYNIAGYFAWWLNFRLLRRRHFSSEAVRIFDRLIFPPVHGIERALCPPPVGQSLLAVARAKHD